jgi:hypothetical protein
MIGGPELTSDEQRIVDWLASEYRTNDCIPTDARHMISVIKRCIEAGDHRALLRERLPA